MKQAKCAPFKRAQLTLSISNRSMASQYPRYAQFKRWGQIALQANIRQALISIVLVDEVEGQQLNAGYRGKDYATNVLAFALNEGKTVPGLPLMGDIILCAPIVEREASEQGKPLLAHYAHLTIHGLLHLQGFDHQQENEAAVMEMLENTLLNRIGYPLSHLEERL